MKRNRLFIKIILTFVFLMLSHQSLAGSPSGLVTFFSVNQNQECPEGWKGARYAYGRSIIGTTDASEVGQTTGTALTDGQESVLHTHIPYLVNNFSGLFSIADSSYDVNVGDLDSLDIQVSDASLSYPYLQLLVCEKVSIPKEDTLPFSSVAFFNKTQCPKEWSVLNALDSRYIIPFRTQDELAHNSSHNQHTSLYGLESRRDGATQEIGPVLTRINFEDSKLPALSLVNFSQDTVFPNVKLLPCQKESYPEATNNNDDVDDGLVLFFSSTSCPEHFNTLSGGLGRLLVGISTEGSQGLAIGTLPQPSDLYVDKNTSHSHEVSFNLGYSGDFLYNSSTDASGSRSIGLKTATRNESHHLPYTMLNACAYN